MLVFIDESGDPGFKLSKGSSPIFVIALVAFSDIEQSVRTTRAINEIAVRFNLKTEFKFSNSRPDVRDAFFATVVPFDFCVRAIVIKKEKIYSPLLRTDKDKFYSFFVKSMLTFDGGLLANARIVIDGSGEQSFKRELASYIRRHTGPNAVRDLRFSNSKNDRLIQMADMCTGAIARSYREDRSDAARWRSMLAPKIEDIWDFK